MGVAYHLKTLIARHPSLAIPIARARGHGAVVSSEADLVIEGFPRTGSTFAVAAFQHAQPIELTIAHHVHAPAQVLYAVRHDIPALVLVRPPEDSVISQVIRNPRISIRQGLIGYIRFYGPLLPVREEFETATFDEVTQDFGAVVRRVNRRYGTVFCEFEHTESNVAAVLKGIEAWYQTQEPPGLRFEEIVPRPSAFRRLRKIELRDPYRAPSLTPLRARADEVYESLVNRRDSESLSMK
jgi:hypothetical protein